MDGDGDEDAEQRRRDGFDLPSILVRLDDRDPAVRRAAVRTIRDHVDDHPDACIPTVPKLRALLEQPSIDVHDEIAYCLAELAAESAGDVAPSTDEIVSFARANPAREATTDLLRCLAAIAVERPDALVDHVASIADVVDAREADDRDYSWGLYLLDQLSTDHPDALEPAVSVLADVLAAAPAENGVTVLAVLGRIARADVTPPSLEFVDVAASLVDHDDDSLRTNAVGCLADVARHHPAAVERACPDLARALENGDPKTRANAAIAIARVADGSGADATADAARDRLLALLEDDHAPVRLNACLALGYGDVAAARDRLAELARSDPDPDVRERAAWARDRLREAGRPPLEEV